VIFRGVFDEALAAAIRGAVQQWAAMTEPFPRGESASRPGLNFHRLDDGSAPTTMPHIFHQFGFATLAGLPRELAAMLAPVSAAMLDLQNALAGTTFALDDPGIRTKVMRHPRGGGFLVPHRHPYLPQRVSIFLNLSQPGVDYSSGGVSFKARGAWIKTFEHFRTGDLLAWRYDMSHEVEPTDPEMPLKWEGDDGFWIYAIEMEEVHSASSVVH
jgi:hypothetical protein